MFTVRLSVKTHSFIICGYKESRERFTKHNVLIQSCVPYCLHYIKWDLKKINHIYCHFSLVFREHTIPIGFLSHVEPN